MKELEVHHFYIYFECNNQADNNNENIECNS